MCQRPLVDALCNNNWTDASCYFWHVSVIVQTSFTNLSDTDGRSWLVHHPAGSPWPDLRHWYRHVLLHRKPFALHLHPGLLSGYQIIFIMPVIVTLNYLNSMWSLFISSPDFNDNNMKVLFETVVEAVWWCNSDVIQQNNRQHSSWRETGLAWPPLRVSLLLSPR